MRMAPRVFGALLALMCSTASMSSFAVNTISIRVGFPTGGHSTPPTDPSDPSNPTTLVKPVLSGLPSTIPVASKGVPYSYSFANQLSWSGLKGGDPAPTAIWSITDLPGDLGLSLNSASGILSGTPLKKSDSVGGNLLTLRVTAPDGYAQKNYTLIIKDPAEDLFKITLSAAPNFIPANGSSKSTLSATVVDADGHPVPVNTPVTWSTSAGVLASNSSATNASGVAVMNLTSPTTKGIATVTVTGSGVSQSTDVEFKADVATVKVSSLSASPATVPADGTSTTTLTAQVKDANGNAVDAGIPVNWSSTKGHLQSTSSTTDASGVAKMVLTSVDSATGPATISAIANNNGVATTTTVTFTVPEEPAKVASLVASLTSIPADGISTSTLTATINDNDGNRVGAGVQVSWSTSLGQLSSGSTITDAYGVTTNTLTSISMVIGTATVSASSNIGSKSTSVDFTMPAVAPGDPATAKVATLAASPPNVPANGTANTTLTSTVVDSANKRVGSGVLVSWSTTLGVLGASNTVTDGNGVATNTLTPVGTATGTATVTASATAGSKTVGVSFITQNASGDAASGIVDTLVASVSSLPANGVSSTTVTATVVDSTGKRVGTDGLVCWQTSIGTFLTFCNTPDANGVATNTLTSTKGAVGAANVHAGSYAGGPDITVDFTPPLDTTGNANTGKVTSLVASVSSLPADGVSTTTLTAIVTDDTGKRVGSDGMVCWSSTRGGTFPLECTPTDGYGVATNVLTSPATNPYTVGQTTGIVTIHAGSYYGGPDISINFTIPAGVPGNPNTAVVDVLVASLYSLPANGTSTTSLTATVNDATGRRVGAGVDVCWLTTIGTFATGCNVTNASGIATNTLTSTDGITGTAAVHVGSNMGGTDISITFTP